MRGVKGEVMCFKAQTERDLSLGRGERGKKGVGEEGEGTLRQGQCLFFV